MSSTPDPDESRPRQVENDGWFKKVLRWGVASRLASVSMIEFGARERPREGSAPRQPTHTGSGHSADGTSGQWQGSPFAGRRLAGDSMSSSRHGPERIRASRDEDSPLTRPMLRRRAQARGGLNGKTVIGGRGVSASRSSPIRRREVLLAHVLSPLRVTSADRKGRRHGSSVGKGTSSSGKKGPAPLVIEISRYARPILPRETGTSAGSTRLMRYEVQCSRGSRDDRSERAPPGPWPAPQGVGHILMVHWLLLSAMRGDAGGFGARLHRRRAGEPVRGRRGKHPESWIG